MSDLAIDGKVRWPLIIRVNDQRAPAQTSTLTLTLTVTTMGPIVPEKERNGLRIPDGSNEGTYVQPINIKAM